MKNETLTQVLLSSIIILSFIVGLSGIVMGIEDENQYPIYGGIALFIIAIWTMALYGIFAYLREMNQSLWTMVKIVEKSFGSQEEDKN